jgi:hypothetical protein
MAETNPRVSTPASNNHPYSLLFSWMNYNNIDLMMIQGHDFLPAVGILEKWLMEYSRELGRRTASDHSSGK